MSLNATLATAARSLDLFSTGVQVAGQNVSNASTPGYIRETLLLEPGVPYHRGSLVLGTGALATGIRQQIDKHLEDRIYAANGDASAAQVRDSVYQQLQTQINELGDADLSTSVNTFLAKVNDVVNQPQSGAVRQLAVQQGQQLATDITSLRTRIDGLRTDQTDKVDALVKEANGLIDQISTLNPQISKLESGGLLGSDAGELRTQRYNALNRLSQIIPVHYEERSNGAVDVYVGSDYVILGGTTQHLETAPATDRQLSAPTVQLSRTGGDVSRLGGELGGTIEGRDTILGGFVDQLDSLASNLITQFNQLHASGEGLKGYTSITSDARIADPTAALNAAGLTAPPQHGSFQLKVIDTRTGQTNTTTIPVNLNGVGPQTSLNDLQAALAAVPNVSASVTAQGRLQLSAASGYEIRFGDDTSGVLASLGVNTFFTGSDSSNIGVSATVAGDPAYFATSLGGGPSDNRNAVRMAAFFDQPVAALGGATLDDHYTTIMAGLAQSASSETAVAKGAAGFRDSLMNQRQQISGVSLDEEAIQLMNFQHAYQAAARMVSTVDQLMTTLLNL